LGSKENPKQRQFMLTGNVLVQCFSGREFSAHRSVSMGTAADWMQLGSWKKNISWHKLISSSDTWLPDALVIQRKGFCVRRQKRHPLVKSPPKRDT